MLLQATPVIDEYIRQCTAVYVSSSWPSQEALETLRECFVQYGKPKRLRRDSFCNGRISYMAQPSNRDGLEKLRRLNKLVGIMLDTLKALIYFVAFIGLAAILVICTGPWPV